MPRRQTSRRSLYLPCRYNLTRVCCNRFLRMSTRVCVGYLRSTRRNESRSETFDSLYISFRLISYTFSCLITGVFVIQGLHANFHAYQSSYSESPSVRSRCGFQKLPIHFFPQIYIRAFWAISIDSVKGC